MGDEQAVRLLAAGANINEIDEEGRTPLLKPNEPYPPEFTEVTILYLSEARDDGGRLWLEKREGSTSGSRWDPTRRRVYSTGEWDALVRSWEADYPESKLHPYETDSYRVRQTNDTGIIQDCWDKIEASGRLTGAHWKGLLGQYADLFRLDRYGNVIANRSNPISQNNSITFFDVDHVFPWSRGGRSVRNNFVACQYAANRDAKRAKLLCTLTEEEMLRGISLGQFEALFEYCREKEGAKPSRSNVANNRRQVVDWLTTTPRKGQGISNFQASTATANLVKEDGDPDGALLWNFLENHFSTDVSTATVAERDGESTTRDEGTNATPCATPRAPARSTPRSTPKPRRAPQKDCPACKAKVACKAQKCPQKDCGHIFVTKKQRDAAAAAARDEEVASLRAENAAQKKEIAELRARLQATEISDDATRLVSPSK